MYRRVDSAVIAKACGIAYAVAPLPLMAAGASYGEPKSTRNVLSLGGPVCSPNR